MGSVYTWDDVHRGRVPKYESFGLVVQNIQTRLKACNAVKSAVLCGSVLRGDHNRRSDIDCVVVYETSREAAAMETMRLIAGEAAKLFVPVNFVPVDSELAASSMHHLGRSFLYHIEISSINEGLIKGGLIECLAATITIAEEARSYVRSKTYNLQEGSASFSGFSGERQASYLKKVLESPLHIARKMLHRYDLMGADSKAEVRDRYGRWANAEIQEPFTRLLELDGWYSEELERQLECPDEKRYTKEAWGRIIDIGIPNAIQFARLNALQLHESLQ